MKPYHTIAVPHKDILDGRLEMDVFAADLWEAYNNRGSEEYRDPATFFDKTYITNGLKNLIEVIENRIKGVGGDPVIQIQTPFGGGKTHALIALMHKAAEWNAKRVVIVGTNLSASDTLWGVIEKQLSGKNELMTELTSPGKEKLKTLLSQHKPLVILMDEVLEYVTKAAGVKVEQSTLSAQTMAFIQELTETVSILNNICLVVTLPSSLMEQYDQSAEKLYAQIQKIVGRVEKIYTPVKESEIAKVIRRRLFSSIDEVRAKKVINSFIEYAQKENILPSDIEQSIYRDRFIESYPFIPEVIDVLYHRWGSFPTFQRTRGVLRLLSLVIHSTINNNIPYISLADFDLAQQTIRQELIKHIGSEYNSVIAQDITDINSGSKRVDENLGNSYKGFHLSTRAATTVFMYSFSGGVEKGTTLTEIKRSATTINNPSSVVAEAVEQLKGKLFYFQIQNDKYFFSNSPNLNRIILTKMENIQEDDIKEFHRELLKKSISGGFFKIFIWEEDSSSIPDTEDFVLVILREENKNIINNILRSKGNNHRVNSNTVFFLFPNELERLNFINLLKRYKAYQSISKDTTISLSKDQIEGVINELRKIESEIFDSLRRLYRYIGIPAKEDYRKQDMGIPTYGEHKSIDQEIYEKLRENGEILEKIVPLVIKERYLSNRDYVLTEQILKSCYRTPSEPRIRDRNVLQEAIILGVEKGIFGLGELHGDKPVCRYYKEKCPIGFAESEVIINDQLCKGMINNVKANERITGNSFTIPQSDRNTQAGVSEISSQQEDLSTGQEFLDILELDFEIPKGRVHDFLKMLNYLQSQFDSTYVVIKASKGKISKQEYENKVLETLRQLGVKKYNY